MICLVPLTNHTASVMDREKSKNEMFNAETTSTALNIRNDCGDDEKLPLSFVPTDKDVICGRARENFHHGKVAKKLVPRPRDVQRRMHYLSHACPCSHLLLFFN